MALKWKLAFFCPCPAKIPHKNLVRCTHWKIILCFIFTNYYTTFLFCFVLFLFFRVTSSAYGDSKASGWIRAIGQWWNWSCSCWPTPQPQQCGIWAKSANCTTAHGKAGSLTHWMRPGIEPTSSWIPAGFLTAEPQGNSSFLFKIESPPVLSFCLLCSNVLS